jgi:hypothetical protein
MNTKFVLLLLTLGGLVDLNIYALNNKVNYNANNLGCYEESYKADSIYFACYPHKVFGYEMLFKYTKNGYVFHEFYSQNLVLRRKAKVKNLVLFSGFPKDSISQNCIFESIKSWQPNFYELPNTTKLSICRNISYVNSNVGKLSRRFHLKQEEIYFEAKQIDLTALGKDFKETLDTRLIMKRSKE